MRIFLTIISSFDTNKLIRFYNYYSTNSRFLEMPVDSKLYLIPMNQQIMQAYCRKSFVVLSNMVHMNKFSFLLICLCIGVAAQAQTVTVKQKIEKVKGESAEGYTSELEGKKEDVSYAWNKFLKDIGKVKNPGGTITITEPAIGATVYPKGILYATSEGNEEKATIWLGLNKQEWEVNDIEIVTKELEKLVYRFGVKFYRDQIQKQIDEAQQASDAVDKQKQRLLNQNKDLVNKLSNNEQQKMQLEKSLETNKLDNFVLLQKIENNKKSQDSVANAGVQIKKVVEVHKERQRKVN